MNNYTDAPEGNKDFSIVTPDDVTDMILEVDRAYQDGELYSYTLGVAKIEALSIVAKARCIFLWKENWENLREQYGTEYDFYSFMLNLGVKDKRTVDLYYDTWLAVEETVLPTQVPLLASKGISYISPPAKAYAQGLIEMNSERWEEVMDCSTRGEVAQLVREWKGVEKKTGTLTIKCLQDGSLVCWKDNERSAVGYLDIGNLEPAVQSAIKRIVNNAGIEME